MKIARIFILCVLMMITNSCITQEYSETITDRIIHKTAIKLKKEKQLFMIGFGGRIMDDVKLLRLEFDYFQLVTLKESRELIIYTIKTFLKNINENKKIRPYLQNYPFNSKNIEIKIWIIQPDGHPPLPGNIQCISLVNNTLLYRLTEPSKFAPMPILHKETYEEGLQILEVNP